MNYLEENALDQIQKMIESGLGSILLTAVQKRNAEVVQHLLLFPVVQTHAIGFCDGQFRYPNPHIFIFKFPQGCSSERKFLQSQLDIFYQNQPVDEENLKNKWIGTLKKYLSEVVSEAIKLDETSLRSVNTRRFRLLKLLDEFKDDKKTLDELKQENKNLLDMWMRSDGHCSAVARLCEQISTALRIFFNACDRLQSVATGDMIDKPDRQQIFRKSSREISVETIQNISDEFVKQIGILEEAESNSEQHSKPGPL